MARTFKLVVGGSEVDLIATSPGIAGAMGRTGGYTIPEGVLGGGRVTETYELLARDANIDDLAAQARAFVALVIKAKLYHEEIWQTDPGYIVQEIEGETNARYSLVYTALELEVPSLLGPLLETSFTLKTLRLTLVREHPWRSNAPGTIGTAITLAETDGPATPTKVHIANFRDDGAITDVKTLDGAVFDDVGLNDNLMSPTPAQGDYTVLGSTDIPLKHYVIPALATAGNLTTTTLLLKYYDSAAWQTLTQGTDYTIYPSATLEACLEQNTEDIVINLFPPSDMAKVVLDGVNAYWIKIEETNAAPAYAQVPQTNAADDIYAQATPEVEIPAASIKGDSPPLFLFRLRSPAGGDEFLSPANISRILIGLKTDGLTKFTSHLNAGGEDNPGDWTTSYGTDSSAVADMTAPGGKHCAVSFATDASMVMRAQFLGDNILDTEIGEYLAMIRCEQIGGDAGDLKIMLRTFIGSTDNSAPHANSKEVKLAGVDQGPEAVDLEFLQLPFTRAYTADSLANTDVIYQIFAERTTGTSTLVIYDLVRIPLAGSVGADDPISDSALGSSALRGLNALDIDAGVIDWRVLKYSIESGNLIPAEDWAVMDEPPAFKNLATKTRLYFMMLHYPVGGVWGEGPLISSLGCHLSFETFGHYRYAVLRGSD